MRTIALEVAAFALAAAVCWALWSTFGWWLLLLPAASLAVVLIGVGVTK